MRSLIDEWGHLAITLFVASVLLVTLIFEALLPQMKEHTKIAIAEDVADVSTDHLAMAKHVSRQSPVLFATNHTMTSDSTFYFGNYFADEDCVYAENADGEDITHLIRVTPANEETREHYNEELRIFGLDELEVGEYKFILSVMDITDDEYFGKETKVPMYITVERPEPEPDPEVLEE